MNKYKSTFFNNCYEWLFSEEERKPMGFITIFFLIIAMSTVISLFIVSAAKHLMY